MDTVPSYCVTTTNQPVFCMLSWVLQLQVCGLLQSYRLDVPPTAQSTLSKHTKTTSIDVRHKKSATMIEVIECNVSAH